MATVSGQGADRRTRPWLRPVAAAIACATIVVCSQAGGARVAGAGVALEAIDAHVRAFIEQSAIPGAAYAIVRDGEVTHLGAAGTTGRDGRAMTPQTPIVIGSVGKSITALAIRQLIDGGRVDVDAPVTRYLSWFTLAGPATATGAITIRSLLDHTSGLSTADGQDPRWYEPGRSPEDVVRGLAGVATDRPAGSYEYSNLNYVILGMVVEAVAGQTYGDYVRDHVFGPLGMTRSFTELPEVSATGLAQGHRYLFGIPVPFDEPYPSAMVAAGYQVSTAEDMARFVAALANGGVYGGIDIVGQRAPEGPPRRMATDWQPIGSLGGGATIGQSGSTLSSNADILEQPDLRMGVVVLLNANPTQLLGVPAGAADLALDLLRLATGSSVVAVAPDVRTVYVVVDVLLAVLVGLFAVHLVRVGTWRRRFASTGHRRMFLARAVAADLAVPLCVLAGVPLLIGASGSSREGDPIAGWAFALWTLPDLASVALALAVGGLVLGAVKLAWVRSGPRHRAAWSGTRPAVAGHGA